MFIQKHSKAIVDQLIKTGKPEVPVSSKRFHFYDSVLLEVLAGKKLSARNIFTPIIKKNKPQHLLRLWIMKVLYRKTIKSFLHCQPGHSKSCTQTALTLLVRIQLHKLSLYRFKHTEQLSYLYQ
jgi:hypothetical protein